MYNRKSHRKYTHEERRQFLDKWYNKNKHRIDKIKIKAEEWVSDGIESEIEEGMNLLFN